MLLVNVNVNVNNSDTYIQTYIHTYLHNPKCVHNVKNTCSLTVLTVLGSAKPNVAGISDLNVVTSPHMVTTMSPCAGMPV